MKKTLITLLIISLFSLGLFAANPGPSSFDVKTTVSSINLMRLTTVKNVETAESAFIDTDTYPTFTGPVNVSTYGKYIGDTAIWISTLSNSRVGYTVTMSATAMTSPVEGSNTATIHYSVEANNKTVDTKNNPDSEIIIDTLTGGLAGVAAESHEITLTVDQQSFEAAVEGTYTGTVTFTWATS